MNLWTGGGHPKKLIFFALIILVFFASKISFGGVAPTTVRITICGDGVRTGIEVCDLGNAYNQGLYSTSTAERQCMPGCMAYAPYCGDEILHPLYSEECDDGNNTSNDRCSNICKIENLPSGGGGGGSGSFIPGGTVPPRQTRVILQGKAYPGANVNILKDGEPIGIVPASPSADFYFTTTDITPGVVTFGFWAEDSKGLKSIALTTTLTVIQGAATTISGAFLPPTISIDKRKLNKGEILQISGQTAPSVRVATHVNSEEEIITPVNADRAGVWKLDFNTSPLKDEDFHSAKALFETNIGGNVVKSAFSQELSFYVGRKDIGKGLFADLNGDGRVNLIDFSIMLFYWNSAGPVGDLNNDKKVNLTDFSMLLFYWTG